MQYPLFTQNYPDLPQLRAALVHAPGLVQSFLTLYGSYQAVHVAGLMEKCALLDVLIQRSGIADPGEVAQLCGERANPFAAAVLIPNAAFLAEAKASKYVAILTQPVDALRRGCHPV